jgi:hypothetical protein
MWVGFPPKWGGKHFLFNDITSFEGDSPSLLVFPNGDIMFLKGR